MIHESAILAHVHLALPSRKKTDKKRSIAYDKAHGARVGTTTISLTFIPAGTPLDDVGKLMRQTRDWHYKQTLPWSDEGPRLLALEGYLDYMTGLGAWFSKIEKAVDAFEQAYPDIVREAQLDMQGLYDPNFFPPAETIRDKFRWEPSFTPIENQEDFRIKASEKVISQLKASTERQVQRGIAAATESLVEKLVQPLSTLYGALTDEKAIQKTTIRKLADVCQSIQRFGGVDNPELANLARECEKLAKSTIPGLRKGNQTATAIEASAYQDALRKAASIL